MPEPNTEGGDTENPGVAFREEKEKQMRSTTVRVSVEVCEDGDLTDEERKNLAIAVLEEGLNTEFASWDDNYPVPTRGNRRL